MKSFKIFLFLALFILSACATPTVPKTPITASDLGVFKGVWKGIREINWGQNKTYDPTVMEIYNDSLPLKGKMDITYTPRGEIIPVKYDFDNGQIDQQGNLVIQLGKNEAKTVLSLYREENKLKLEGNYIYTQRGVRGILTLYKK